MLELNFSDVFLWKHSTSAIQLMASHIQRLWSGYSKTQEHTFAHFSHGSADTEVRNYLTKIVLHCVISLCCMFELYELRMKSGIQSGIFTHFFPRSPKKICKMFYVENKKESFKSIVCHLFHVHYSSKIELIIIATFSTCIPAFIFNKISFIFQFYLFIHMLMFIFCSFQFNWV